MATSSSYGNALEEWKEARAVLARFDENLHDLRKYGFIFLAALLASDSIQTILKLEENARLALILITIVFIIALRLVDKNYEQFQSATVIRAMILERILNIELTETISYRYRRDRFSLHVQLLYISFIVLAGGLGSIILSVGYQLFLSLAFATAGIAFILAFPKTLNLILRHSEGLPEEDWIIDRLSCEQGEKVRIIITNLDEKYIKFESGEVVCEIKEEGGNWAHEVKAESQISIPGYGNHSWLWDTKQAKPDKIYRVQPRGWNVPLKRSIMVYKHKPRQQSQSLTRTKSRNNVKTL